jgi:primosomal protein N' (replication factor Y)
VKIARVAIDVPASHLFDYGGEDLSAQDEGRLCVIQFGKKNVTGLIVEVVGASEVPAARLKKINAVMRDGPALIAEDLALMKFAAAYYRYALGVTIMSTLPLQLRRGKTLAAAARYILTGEGVALTPTDFSTTATVRRRLLSLMKKGGPVDVSAIRSIAPSALAVLREWLGKRWVAQVEAHQEPSWHPTVHTVMPGPKLTHEQTVAVEAIRDRLHQFAAFLLFGATGSGKTEVYLHSMDQVLRSGRQTLILVPEIALTPQLEATVRTRFPATPLVTLHSGLNETERLANWRAAHSGSARIVLGTRLAVFTPMPELGLIVVDEEHDASLKQPEGLRYSARDLAVVRARQRGIPIVLGSATPALETYHNALSGRYELLTLRQRINRNAPHIEYISTRGQKLADGLSEALLSAIAQRLEHKEQSLVFINRRGFAPVLLCGSCGWLSRCHRCTANLVLHQAAHQLRCHHCGHQGVIPAACPDCGSQELHPVGHGTQRIEKSLRAHFPHARILRIDRDSTRRKLAWPDMRRQIELREVDILVGTQILAKGHDFPHLNLVAVLNVDGLLYSIDIRASERLYALLTQVAGRAGRGDAAGQVYIQTDFPDHPLYRALQDQNYAAFAQSLLEERRQAGFPPYVYQVLLRAEAPRMDIALAFLARAAHVARAMPSKVTIYDPVPAAMARLAGRERAQLLVQSTSRGELQEFLTAWQAELLKQRSSRARWSLDVDPLEF